MDIRQLDTKEIKEAIAQMCIQVNEQLSPDMEGALLCAVRNEEDPVGKMVLETLAKNLEIARTEHVPICQDTGMAVVFIDIGQDVHLTPNEFKIVALLGKHAGRVMTYKSILRQLWGPSASMDNKILRVHMASIRRKIEPDPIKPRYIFTEVGVGYRMAEAEDEEETKTPDL